MAVADVTGRSRVSRGVPTGGEFAAETKGENPDLAAPRTTRERLEDALAAGASGTHAELLERYRKAYANVDDHPLRFGERTRLELDQAVEREFALQAEVDALVDGFDGNTAQQVNLQEGLFRLHEWKVTRGESTTGLLPIRIYNPRTAQTFTIRMSPSSADLVDQGRYTIRDLLEGELMTAYDYETAGSVDGWFEKFNYRDTLRHHEVAEGAYSRAKQAADDIRPLLGADYSLYVLGRQDGC